MKVSFQDETKFIRVETIFNVTYLTYLPEKQSVEGKYASFKNTKFSRSNYQTDSFEL